MFTQRNGKPFPGLWWLLALTAVGSILLTVGTLLAAIWLKSWQFFGTSLVICIIAIFLTVMTCLWADDMT